MAGIELQGRSALEGRIRRRGDVVAVEAGRLSSEALSFAGHRAEDLRVRFAFANDALEIESLDLRAYGGTLHHAGRFVLGEGPSFDVRLEAAGVDAGRLLGVAVEGADPEQPFRPRVPRAGDDEAGRRETPDEAEPTPARGETPG